MKRLKLSFQHGENQKLNLPSLNLGISRPSELLEENIIGIMWVGESIARASTSWPFISVLCDIRLTRA
jgi:hypothetical protein